MIGQFYGFAAEFSYVICTVLLRFVGRRYFGIDIMELVNCLKITEFGTLSMVQVLTSSELRKELFNMFLDWIT